LLNYGGGSPKIENRPPPLDVSSKPPLILHNIIGINFTSVHDVVWYVV